MGYLVLFCILANQYGSAYAFAVTGITLVVDMSTMAMRHTQKIRKEQRRIAQLHPPVQLQYGERRTRDRAVEAAGLDV